MDQACDVVFYLDRSLLTSARAGEHNFIALVSKVLSDAGLRVLYGLDTPRARQASADRPGYALFHMVEPFHPRALTFRRNYVYPFWQIERSSRRWEWAVARSTFRPDEVDRDDAARFHAFWRARLFPGIEPSDTAKGPVLVPLQGKIRDCRSFQACSPVEMIRRTAARLPDHDIVVTLHPRERYAAADIEALTAVVTECRRVEIGDQSLEKLLPRCRAVVTQNSSVALKGYFLRKPAVLFGQIDFHHIAGNVPRDGEDQAFDMLSQHHDYAGYLWWFLQARSINAGRPEAPVKIAEALRRNGWPIR